MSLEGLLTRRNDLLATIGRTGLNLAFPDEFELYVFAFELLAENGDTISYFIFPVNPSSFDESKPEITNIKKTLGGVTVLSHPGFIPGDVTLSGNFGRKFRILIGDSNEELLGGFKNTMRGAKDFFSNNIKTGYGCIKLLESIVEDSKKVDSETGIKTLIFHNLALGNSYIVKPLSLRFSMSQESNMIWNYSLTLKSIAPLKALFSEQELTDIRHKLVLKGFLQSQTNSLVDKLSNIL